MSRTDCTCPPERDVFRHPVYTREPCPLHPEPDLSGITFLPRMEPEGLASRIQTFSLPTSAHTPRSAKGRVRRS